MSDKIEIISVGFSLSAEIMFCEWRRNGELKFLQQRTGFPLRDGEQPSIPDDVRVALALLVAPGLVCPVDERDAEIARLRKPTTEMATKAWEVFRGNRRGRLLGEGPAFREAFEAAFSALDPKGDQP